MRIGFSGARMKALIASALLATAMAGLARLGGGSQHALLGVLAVWIAASLPFGILFGHLALD
ncbi:MAG: hypothetical protein KGL12_13490 [Rhodospirillales bacterium]|nr:hypothetical protein [Rhodospirillales bacterium]